MDNYVELLFWILYTVNALLSPMMLGFEKVLYTCLHIVTLVYFWIHTVHALLSPLMFRFDEADQ